MTDEVKRPKAAPDATTGDVEGHMGLSAGRGTPPRPPAMVKTGHGGEEIAASAADDTTDGDVEAHKFRGAGPADEPAANDDENDDVEGHKFRGA